MTPVVYPPCFNASKWVLLFFNCKGCINVTERCSNKQKHLSLWNRVCYLFQKTNFYKNSSTRKH